MGGAKVLTRSEQYDDLESRVPKVRRQFSRSSFSRSDFDFVSSTSDFWLQEQRNRSRHISADPKKNPVKKSSVVWRKEDG